MKTTVIFAGVEISPFMDPKGVKRWQFCILLKQKTRLYASKCKELVCVIQRIGSIV